MEEAREQVMRDTSVLESPGAHNSSGFDASMGEDELIALGWGTHDRDRPFGGSPAATNSDPFADSNPFGSNAADPTAGASLLSQASPPAGLSPATQSRPYVCVAAAGVTPDLAVSSPWE
eukprot:SAG31_NODE_22371_length_527_cov_0.841121_1_plen_118_part_10